MAALLVLFSPGLGVHQAAASMSVAPKALGAGTGNQAAAVSLGGSGNQALQSAPGMVLPGDSMLAPAASFSAAQQPNVALPLSTITSGLAPVSADGNTVTPGLALPSAKAPLPAGERSLMVLPSGKSGQMPGMGDIASFQAPRGQDSRGLRELAAGLLRAFKLSEYSELTPAQASIPMKAASESQMNRGQGFPGIGTVPQRLSLSLSRDGMQLSFAAHEAPSLAAKSVSSQASLGRAMPKTEPSRWESFDWTAFKAWLAALFLRAYGTLSFATP